MNRRRVAGADASAAARAGDSPGEDTQFSCSLVAGKVSGVVGDLSRAAGDFSRTAGNFSRPTGNFSRTAGDFSRTAGDFSRTAGDFSRTAGELSRSAGELSRTAGELPKGAEEAAEGPFFIKKGLFPRFQRPGRRLAGFLALVGLAGVLTGCQTIGHIQPINLSEPGWRVRTGQAVWKMPGNRPELAGEMTFAVQTNGTCFADFSKTPFTMVLAKCSATRWEIEFPPQKLFFGGGGAVPPKHFAWLQLCRALTGQSTRPPWRFESRADGSWRLENPRTQEAVEGFLEP